VDGLSSVVVGDLPCHLAHSPLDLLGREYGAKLAGLESLVHLWRSEIASHRKLWCPNQD
jgi:hypothetical protein